MQDLVEKFAAALAVRRREKLLRCRGLDDLTLIHEDHLVGDAASETGSIEKALKEKYI